MNTTYTVSKIGAPTEKGNVTLSVTVTKGFLNAPLPYYMASTKAAIEKAGVKVGDDITEIASGCKIRESEVSSPDPETGEITTLTFKWLEPVVD